MNGRGVQEPEAWRSGFRGDVAASLALPALWGGGGGADLNCSAAPCFTSFTFIQSILFHWDSCLPPSCCCHLQTWQRHGLVYWGFDTLQDSLSQVLVSVQAASGSRWRPSPPRSSPSFRVSWLFNWNHLCFPFSSVALPRWPRPWPPAGAWAPLTSQTVVFHAVYNLLSFWCSLSYSHLVYFLASLRFWLPPPLTFMLVRLPHHASVFFSSSQSQCVSQPPGLSVFLILWTLRFAVLQPFTVSASPHRLRNRWKYNW